MHDPVIDESASGTQILVSAVIVYPVKGAGGVALESCAVEPRGLSGDRRWMVVDDEGVFVTQRTQPRLALARPTQTDDGWRLAADGLGEVVLPASGVGGPRITVTVWGDRVEAVEAQPALAEWFGELLRSRCRLVYMPDAASRLVDRRFANRHPVSFADGFPVLVVGQASLDDLNSRLVSPVPMDRFRPNVIVSGAPAFAEDDWSLIAAGGVTLRLVKPCSRCVVTTIDQRTALRQREPLVTLASYRTVGDKVVFGQNALPERPGVLSCGDRVVVLHRRVDQA